MHGRLYLDTMHADCANLIMWYLLIWWFDLETGHTVATVRISRSFLWYEMNEWMHVMQTWFWGYMDRHSSHFHLLNHGCKIECLQHPTPLDLWLALTHYIPYPDSIKRSFNSLSYIHNTLLVYPLSYHGSSTQPTIHLNMTYHIISS